MATGRTVIPPRPCPIPGCMPHIINVDKHLKEHQDLTVSRIEVERAKVKKTANNPTCKRNRKEVRDLTAQVGCLKRRLAALRVSAGVSSSYLVWNDKNIVSVVLHNMNVNTLSLTNLCNNMDEDLSESKERAGDGGAMPTGEAPKKKLSHSTRSTDVKRDVSFNEDAGDVNQNLSSASSQEEKIFEMSSSANTSTADFEDKYYELCRLGIGGYGYVYHGLRKSDGFPVAIKHIPNENVRWEQVICNGKEFKIILEVAFMLKAAGLPGSVGQSAAVSLLDWYILDEELILVMENPVDSMDLWDYIESRGESLKEHEAKMILKQLVDAAIDMHSKSVFHRDIKLENVLIQKTSGVPRVRIIDFGCGCFSTDTPYESFWGTLVLAPPEWIQCQKYWARPTTVWQLGVLFYSLLQGHVPFSTVDYINNDIKFNPALSTGKLAEQKQPSAAD
ncbi:Serine/threonine-protein kinase pim-2 [Collichthys lucidus]|uniref:non-specific serine/threonine protein kinase n=1 Tax=Collichthys lucidus TaxID=240159 RepID=A0A4U5U7Q7_COLLU|nr:Serine/threonine-protein kinase pim-2 [Collichthys lucidus]